MSFVTAAVFKTMSWPSNTAPEIASARPETAAPKNANEFVDTIRHLELRLKITEAICHSFEVERFIEALRISASLGEQEEQKIATPVVAREGNAASIAPILADIDQGSSDLKSGAEKTGAPAVTKFGEAGQTENLIAGTICQLYDRLGGFIKP
jgi:hypothetical protein